MSNDALRVLGAAYKSLAALPSKSDAIEENLTFIGLVGMIDPPRLEVKDSIALCKKAGIKTIMITGDHKNTAFALGNKVYPDSLMHAQTMAFAVLSISQLFHSLNMRHPDKSIFQLGLFTNKYLIYSIILGILLQVIVITVPALASIFKVYPLTLRDWAFVLILSTMPLVINEIVKAIRRGR